MLTLESIKKERPNDSDANIMAFLRFAKCFDCLDANTYEEAHEKISVSMSMISDELESIDDQDEQHRILCERYAML